MVAPAGAGQQPVRDGGRRHRALIANTATIGAAQQFDIVDLGGGNIALRARVNNMYVCAENAGANPLIANRAAVGPWETFTRVNNSDGSVSLRATVNNMYVVAENAGAAAADRQPRRHRRRGRSSTVVTRHEGFASAPRWPALGC